MEERGYQMARFSDLHLQLEMAAEAFHKAPTEENGNRVVKEMKKLIENDSELLFEGVDGGNGMTPGGFYGADGKFYFHVFSSRMHLENIAGKAMVAPAGQLFSIVKQNSIVGGFSLNHMDDTGAILITQEELEA